MLFEVNFSFDDFNKNSFFLRNIQVLHITFRYYEILLLKIVLLKEILQQNTCHKSIPMVSKANNWKIMNEKISLLSQLVSLLKVLHVIDHLKIVKQTSIFHKIIHFKFRSMISNETYPFNQQPTMVPKNFTFVRLNNKFVDERIMFPLGYSQWQTSDHQR